MALTPELEKRIRTHEPGNSAAQLRWALATLLGVLGVYRNAAISVSTGYRLVVLQTGLG